MADLLYLECSSGISGDMTVASLLDLGADEAAVHRALESLPVQGFRAVVSRVVKSGLDVCDFDVQLDDAHENHDHDMAYLHGSFDASGEIPHDHHHDHDGSGGHGHDHRHSPGHDEGHGHHDHGHGYGHDHRNHGHEHDGHRHEQHDSHVHDADAAPGHHDHGHRGLREVRAIIQAAAMTDGAKALALKVFSIIAEAEAKAHGLPVEDVHFHEVGAIDSIADIVAFAVAFDSLPIRDVVVTALAEGTGSVRCQHGLIPVPAPAVVHITAAHGIPLQVLPIRGELVTPTGAAMVAAVRTQSTLPEPFVIKRVGMGNGKRVYETPGILRAMIIDAVS